MDRIANSKKEVELIHDLPKGLLGWYDFRVGESALYIYFEDGFDHTYDPLYELLCARGLKTDIVSTEEILEKGAEPGPHRYQYVVFSHVLEPSKNPMEFLAAIRPLLSEDGRILFGMNNRLGARYFCGDRDEYTERNFDSIENYIRVNPDDLAKFGGRLYSKEEVRKMLISAGYNHLHFYSVYPYLGEPQVIYADDTVPNEELSVRIFPYYDYPQSVFLEEEKLYRTLIDNGLFHTMANAYLVECPIKGDFAPIKSVTVSMDRGRENALSTIICKDDKVIKRAIYDEGKKKIETLQSNSEYLKQHGVNMIDSYVEGSDYVMPYVVGESAVSYFRRLMEEDLELFYKELDRFWQIILNSSEHVPYEDVDWSNFEPGIKERRYKVKEDDPQKDKWKSIAFGKKDALGAILKRGYIDLVSLNCFVIDGEFVFYDQELYGENVPAYAILRKTISMIYWNSPQHEKIVPMVDLLKRYEIYEYNELYAAFEHYYIGKLRNIRELKEFREKHVRQLDKFMLNRQRMNYSQEDYEKLFINIFSHTDGRDIYLFGSGNYAKKFISEFGNDYDIKGLIDNNESKWGQQVDGIEIVSPKVLDSLENGRYKIIICIRNYVGVMKQLDDLGLNNYSIYDWSRTYPRVQRAIATSSSSDDKPKKYHVGYVAGVFDVFHIGHVNLLRRAKEQCDYLIVGVVTDEQVMKGKRTTPYMSFEDRIEIVRACKYVDEAVEIPPAYADTKEAYRRYQFDVQFSGSDYENDPDWLRQRDYLREHGSDLVFFPYTQSTSSTKLKKEIREGEKKQE